MQIGGSVVFSCRKIKNTTIWRNNDVYCDNWWCLNVHGRLVVPRGGLVPNFRYAYAWDWKVYAVQTNACPAEKLEYVG